MKRMLHQRLAALQDGLLPCPTGERYWHFYDWARGLDGHQDGKRTLADAGRFEAPLNCFFVLALEAAANMARYVADSTFASECHRAADSVRQAVHGAFWHGQSSTYYTRLDDGAGADRAELTQALAILAGAGDATTRRALRRTLMGDSTGLTPTTLSQSLYKYDALLIDESCGGFVRDHIMEQWSRMLFAGATSFWETAAGGWDFHHAASLCHGWSAIPLYLYSAYGLGIKPLAPGFSRVGLNPVLDMVDVSGVVPTPRGEVRVQLKRDSDGHNAHVDLPPAIELVASDRIRYTVTNRSKDLT
jgi:hypothetical protein